MLTTAPTLEQRELARPILEKCQQELAEIFGAPVSIRYQLRVNTINANLIIQIVCKSLNISYTEMVGKSQMEHLVAARFLVCFLVHGYCRLSDTNIGRMINRDRSLVPYAIKKVREMIEVQDSFYITALETIEERISEFTKE